MMNARQYVQHVLSRCPQAQSSIPLLIRAGEASAQRFARDGQVGFLPNGSALPSEIKGRSGGMIHLGLAQGKTPQAGDILLYAWDKPTDGADLTAVGAARRAGALVVGLGPADHAALADAVGASDFWFDSGPADQPGHLHVLANALHGWMFIAEFVSALTRLGKMPTLHRAYACEDGRAWHEKYAAKRFHDDLSVQPIEPGKLAFEYLGCLCGYIEGFARRELGHCTQAAGLIRADMTSQAGRLLWHGRLAHVSQGRLGPAFQPASHGRDGHATNVHSRANCPQGQKIPVASMCHMPPWFVGRYDDTWAQNIDLCEDAELLEAFDRRTAEGQVVLRLGYAGEHESVQALFHRKAQRVILVTAENPRPEYQLRQPPAVRIDMGHAFGDACVTVPGYPIRILPPAGILQLLAYECIHYELQNPDE